MHIFSKLLLLVILLAASTPASAALCGPNNKCKSPFAIWHNSDGTSAKTIYTAPSNGNGVEILGLFCTSTQPTGGSGMQISVIDNTGTYNLNAVEFPTTSGTNQVPVDNLLLRSSFMFYGGSQPWTGLPIDGQSNPFIIISPGDAVTIAFGIATTSPFSNTCYLQVVEF